MPAKANDCGCAMPRRKNKKDSVRLRWRSSGLGKPVNDQDALSIFEYVPGRHGTSKGRPSGRIIHCDNLAATHALCKESPSIKGKVKLIYIDPPFLSNAIYIHRLGAKKGSPRFKRVAYTDKWSKEEYLDMLKPRLEAMRELLSEDGLIFFHCDWRVSAHARLLMDEIFGSENFLNEVIWHYGGRGAKAISGQFPRNHDTICVYGAGSEARLKKVYTEVLIPLSMAAKKGIKIDDDGRAFKTAPRGDYTDQSIRRLEREGRVHWTKNNNARIKYYLEQRGDSVVENKLVGDVWDDIPDAMHMPLKERSGYCTQKPERLLQRIIESATKPGELICDFFSGSGTTAVVAEKLGRRWLVCDQSSAAVSVARARLGQTIEESGGSFTIERLGPDTRETAKVEVKQASYRDSLGKTGELIVTLGNYSANGNERRDKAAITTDGDFTELIDYWAVDWDYDGEIFVSRWSSERGLGKDPAKVEKKASLGLKAKPGRVAIRAVDIFGGSALETVKVEDI